MSQPMDVASDADASAHVRQSSATRRQLPTVPAPSEIGLRRTQEFLRDVFQTPPKSRRLDIASQIKRLECQRNRAVNRIKKTKHQLRELATRLQADETERAQLDDQIRSLKSETLSAAE